MKLISNEWLDDLAELIKKLLKEIFGGKVK
jgi:hypothetical protein